MSDNGELATAKVMRRLLPYAMVLFFFSLLDRANISYAALEMNKDLGLSPTIYGAAAGIFFIGYFIFEVPSNLIMERVGARLWLARIMVTWGLVAGATAFVTGQSSLMTMRFVLGVAEAGLLPGILFYLSQWVPKRERGIAFGWLMATTALAYVIGGPLATALMQWPIPGFLGWQSMFLMEGLLTVLVGFTVFFALPDKIDDAAWLNPVEKNWLKRTLESEDLAKRAAGVTTMRQGFLDSRVLYASTLAFFLVCANFGTVFWLPQIVKAFGGLSNLEVGLLTAVPFLLGGIGGIFWGRHSDTSGDRKWHLAFSAALATVGYAAAGLASSPLFQFLGICIAALGLWSCFGTFWAYCGDLLGGRAAVGGFAVVNSFGSLGGFAGSLLLGYARDHTENFSASLFLLAAFSLITTILAMFLRGATQSEPVTDGARATM